VLGVGKAHQNSSSGICGVDQPGIPPATTPTPGRHRALSEDRRARHVDQLVGPSFVDRRPHRTATRRRCNLASCRLLPRPCADDAPGRRLRRSRWRSPPRSQRRSTVEMRQALSAPCSDSAPRFLDPPARASGRYMTPQCRCSCWSRSCRGTWRAPRRGNGASSENRARSTRVGRPVTLTAQLVEHSLDAVSEWRRRWSTPTLSFTGA